MAGSLLHTPVDTLGERKIRFDVDYTETPRKVDNYTRGQLRWGRQAGCSFVDNSGGQWSSAYRCATHREWGCSFDNRMSAVCELRKWTLPGNREYTCGTYENGQTKVWFCTQLLSSLGGFDPSWHIRGITV